MSGDHVTVPRARLRALISAVLSYQARTRSADPALLASVVELLNGDSMQRTDLSISEYAAATGLSVSTVRRRVADGSLPSRKLGRRVLIAMSGHQLSGALTPLDGRTSRGDGDQHD